jgi:cytochrome c-type biogenesis protein CcmH/NrfG
MDEQLNSAGYEPPAGEQPRWLLRHLVSSTSIGNVAALTLRRVIESFLNLEHPHDKIERSIIKVIVWTVGIILVLVVGTTFGYRSFRAWQQRRLIAEGNALVNEGDFKRASLDARRLLQINPKSAEACRILARIAEKAGLRASLDWRRRVMDLGEATPNDLILLARAGVRFDDRATADAAISRLPESAKETAEYHALLADIAFAQRDGVEMEKQLSEASRLEPANKDYTMRLAALRLGANDFDLRDRGKETLRELQKDPALRRDATRYLAEGALRQGDNSEALMLARELDKLPEKTYADRLVFLSALQATRDSGFQAYLNELQTSSAGDAEQAASLITWMNVHKMSREAIAWSAQLAPAVISNKLVQVALSDAFATEKDWAGLQRLVKSGNWGTIDFLRNALSARALRETGNAPDSAAQWNEAVKKVSASSRHTLMLMETVEKWGWRPEAIDLLWLAAKDPARSDEALRVLYQYFAKNGDTENLYRVLLHRIETQPDDRKVQNNFAQLSLLLNLNVDRAQKMAREIAEKEPANAAYVSTYAFALFVQGDIKKARKTIETLSGEQLHQPEIAAYYGIILAAAGDQARAAEFLDLGEKATLLPQEKALVEKARRSLAQR